MGEVALGANRERERERDETGRFSGAAGSLTDCPPPSHIVQSPAMSTPLLAEALFSRGKKPQTSSVGSRLSKATMASNNGEKLHSFLCRVRALTVWQSHSLATASARQSWISRNNRPWSLSLAPVVIITTGTHHISSTEAQTNSLYCLLVEVNFGSVC